MFQNISLIALGLLVGLSLGMYAFFTKTPAPQAPQVSEQASSETVAPAAAEEVVDPVVITPPMTAAEMLAAQVLPGQQPPLAVEESQAPTVTVVEPKVPAVQTAATAPADISGEEVAPVVADPNVTTEIVATGSGTVLSDIERKRIEEAQADAGWANAKFLPKEALDVIQPQKDGQALDNQITE